MMDVSYALKEFLQDRQIPYAVILHEPTLTSEASAKARGEKLETGGKALLVKVGGEYKLFVISAALQACSKKIKKYFGAKKSRFASKAELLEFTGLVPGSVPPFGKPVLPFPLFVDRSITRNKKIAFNAGLLTESIILSTEVYLKIAQPTIFDFANL